MRLSGGFWAAVLVGGLLPFMFPTAPWAVWPGRTAAEIVLFHLEHVVDSDLGLVGAYLGVIVVNGLAWGALIYFLARIALGRWLAKRA